MSEPTRSSRFTGVVDPAAIADEAQVHWYYRKNAYPYLREAVYTSTSRTGIPQSHTVTVVAYASQKAFVAPDPDGNFRRRFWYIDHRCDPYERHDLVGWPVEAVWPDSVKPRQLSRGPTDEEHRVAHARAARADATLPRFDDVDMLKSFRRQLNRHMAELEMYQTELERFTGELNEATLIAVTLKDLIEAARAQTGGGG